MVVCLRIMILKGNSHGSYQVHQGTTGGVLGNRRIEEVCKEFVELIQVIFLSLWVTATVRDHVNGSNFRFPILQYGDQGRGKSVLIAEE